MNIYTSTKTMPYVYMCTHIKTGKFYIGYREANKIPSDQDLPKYKTSSKIVKPNFEEYHWVIVAEFDSGETANEFEQQLILENWSNPLLLNKNCQVNNSKRFRNRVGLHGEHNPRFGVIVSDQTREKMSVAKRGRKPLNFEMWATASKGKSYFNDGIIEKRFLPNNVPDNWVKGRLQVECKCGKTCDISNLKKYHKNC